LFSFFGAKNPKSEWAYIVVENIFDHIKSVNGITMNIMISSDIQLEDNLYTEW
jgi:hypothetical protein